jgi:WD40 repeat protein
MLWLAGLPAGGAVPLTLAQFPDGSPEAAFYFGPDGGSNNTSLSIPRKAVPTSAALLVEGLPGADGAFPYQPSLRLGTTTVWDFGARLPAVGEMGRQRGFSGGRENLSLTIPEGGGAAPTKSLVLPAGAAVKEASLVISGSPGPLQPRIYSPEASAPRVFWNTSDGTVLEAAASGGAVDFTGRDSRTGAVLRTFRLEPALSRNAYVADIQYDGESGRAALLLPGEGVLVVNLSNGQKQEFFTGPEAASLVAMKFSRGHLAVAGAGWAAVRELDGGATDRVDRAAFPQAAWENPVAVDHDPAARRLMLASRGPSFPSKSVSVFGLDDRTARVFTDTSVTSNVASMLGWPEQSSILLGLSGRGSVNGYMNNHAVIAMSLVDGSVSYVPAFEELRSVSGLQRRGGLLCALGERNAGGSELILVDAQDRSWRTFSGYGAGWDSLRYWDFDPAGQRLLAASYYNTIGVFELDFALEAGTARELPEPAAPVPGQVTAVLAHGRDMIAGTRNGLAVLGPDGRRRLTIDCGRVDAMARDPVTGRVLAAAAGGFRCEPGWGLWDRRTLELVELDLSVDFPAGTVRSVPLPPDWYQASFRGVAPSAVNGTAFLAVSGAGITGLYEVRPDGTFSRIQTPSTSVGQLALSPDGRTLYAACSQAGLLVLDIATGAQELLSPFSESPLLSPNVASISVDESGGVLVAQTPSSGYFIGGATLLEPSPGGKLRTVLSVESPDFYMRSAVRDRAGGRIFAAGSGSLSVIDESDGRRTDLSPGAYINTVDWSAGGRMLACAGSGSAVALCWTDGPPANVGLDIGADGTPDWSGPEAPPGGLRVDLRAALAGRLEAREAGARFIEIPLKVTAGSAGVVRLASLSVVYGLSERVDLQEALVGHLRSLSASGDDPVPLTVSAAGGGLRLRGLNITFMMGEPPRARAVPEVRADAAAASPKLLDLSRYFTDNETFPANLSFRLLAADRPDDVGISLVFGHYMLVDARGSDFRGAIKVSVTATDGQGLSTTASVKVRVHRSGEYIPPPPYYGTLAWVFGAVVLAIGLVALKFYIGGYRKKG